ncbi:Dps family protein [Bradyrhizobium sp. STM 3562]|uniref:Dps family protein n=1 Tax=Bradyrhizobium sp. STM 3562 TaxID=578924 RepID=UPI00388FF1CE
MDLTVESRSTSAAIGTVANFPPGVANEISAALTNLLADVFTSYLKTKNFHWHMSGRHFRDYHLMLDEQADQVFAMVDAVAERCRKIGGRTIRSVGEISRRQRLKDSDAMDLSPGAMLSEPQSDNRRLLEFLRDLHVFCEKHEDVASASVLENWIDEAEGRIWFLFEAVCD